MNFGTPHVYLLHIEDQIYCRKIDSCGPCINFDFFFCVLQFAKIKLNLRTALLRVSPTKLYAIHHMHIFIACTKDVRIYFERLSQLGALF